ncbi:MAG: ATP-binding protein [Sediminibacterium sp.]
MAEQQNIEFKLNWHDDHLKWVCGFANALGGVIFIGKDDHGNVNGISDYKKLMEDLPNKIKNAMGISAEVNLHNQDGKSFIEIVVQPYTVAISLRGRYYFRSGSTNQELTGPTLNEFLLKKSGKTWDDVIEARANFTDIDEKAVKVFLAAAQNAGRLPENDGLDIPELFEKLRLSENGQLKRAAIILFGKDPGKFYPNTFVKIGRFKKDDVDIIFQEVEEANLIFLLQAVLNQLNHKFLIKSIAFEGINRIEKGEYPLAAIREMLLNALVHRNYMGAPTQIRVYDDKINIWNEGALPEGISLASLKQSHASKPRNPIIADVCFKGGYIDSWGRGTIKILETCKEANLPEPELQERDGGFLVTLYKNSLIDENFKKIELNDRQLNSLNYIRKNGKISNKEYRDLNNCSRNTASNDLVEMVEKGFLEASNLKGAGSYYQLSSIAQ